MLITFEGSKMIMFRLLVLGSCNRLQKWWTVFELLLSAPSLAISEAWTRVMAFSIWSAILVPGCVTVLPGTIGWEETQQTNSSFQLDLNCSPLRYLSDAIRFHLQHNDTMEYAPE
jgi:hypothetical protein